MVRPLHMATTFERDPDGAYSRGFSYARAGQPTRNDLEETLADLEGGIGCAAFASGMAAATAVFQSLSAGDHVLIGDDVYHGVRRLLADVLDRWDLRYGEVDTRDVQAVRDAWEEKTALLWAETPSNPMLRISDVEALAEAVHAEGGLLVVDSTWNTPLLQRPLTQGADLVVHSTTKYLSGHSDVVGGAVITREETSLFERICTYQEASGPVADPFSCWLTLRGIRSLPARIERHERSARAVAEFLAGHEKVTDVYYPGLPDHPGHEIANRQMDGFGGMCSFRIDGDRADAMSVVGNAEIFTRATSLGGTESLIEHRASMETPPTSTPENLIRLSIGQEDPDDLIEDLEQALELIAET